MGVELTEKFQKCTDRLSNEPSSVVEKNHSQPKMSNLSTSPKFRGITWITHKVHFAIHSKVLFTNPILSQPKAVAPKTIHSSFQLNQFRMMWENVDMYGDFRPFKCWWLYEEGDGFTENNMMRSPFSGRYFKLAYDPTDYYGVDQVDMHSHGASQY